MVRSLFRKKPSPKTIIVDTTHLLAQDQKVDRVWTLEDIPKSDLLSHAALATLHSTSSVARVIKTTQKNKDQQRAKPLHTTTKPFTTTTWHHGRRYITYAVGSVTALLAISSLSDSDREAYQLQSRAFTAKGRRVYGVAIGEGANTNVTPTEFCGLIVLSRSLDPRVPEIMRRAKRGGQVILYITSDPPLLATEIGRDAGLLTKAAHAVDWSLSPRLHLSRTVYANVDKQERSEIITTLGGHVSPTKNTPLESLVVR